ARATIPAFSLLRERGERLQHLVDMVAVWDRPGTTLQLPDAALHQVADGALDRFGVAAEAAAQRVDVYGNRQSAPRLPQAPQAVPHDTHTPQARREVFEGDVRPTQPLALDVEHAEDDIEVVLRHHGVHIAANGEERGVL